MRCYLCAGGHHFRRATPTCPIPDCTAEVRITAIDPRELVPVPAFHLLPRVAA